MTDILHLPAQRAQRSLYTTIFQYLQDPLVVDLVEDRAVDLVGFEGDPVEHWQTELGLDGLLDLHG